MALKPIKLDNETRRELGKKLDPKLIKHRDQFGGKGKLSYISANTGVDILNHVFGHNWSFRIVERWMEEGIPAPFTAKNGKEPVPQPPTAWCIVEVSVPFKDEDGHIHIVTKSAFGSQAITGGQSTQAQNGYKGAQSDALKKAATLFGVALELYRDPEEEQHFQEINEEVFNVWTDELKEQYAEQFKYIDSICTLNGYEISDLAYWVGLASEYAASNLYEMDPVYMDELVELLKHDEDLTQP